MCMLRCKTYPAYSVGWYTVQYSVVLIVMYILFTELFNLINFKPLDSTKRFPN